MTEGLDRAIDRCSDLGENAHIGRMDGSLSAGGGNRREALMQGLGSSSDKHDFHTGGGEFPGQGGTDTTPCAGD